MDDLAAAVHARLDNLEAAIHRKFDALLQGMHHLIEKGTDMSKIADDLNALSGDISTLATDNATKTSTLVGFKDENDNALSGAVSSLTSARDALKQTGTDLDQAIAAHQAGTVSGAAPVEQPAAAVTQQLDASGLPVAS